MSLDIILQVKSSSIRSDYMTPRDNKVLIYAYDLSELAVHFKLKLSQSGDMPLASVPQAFFRNINVLLRNKRS